MGLPVRFIPHSVYLTTSQAATSGSGGSSISWINQVDGTPLDAGISLFEESSGSATDREFVATRDVQPTMPLSASDVSLLANIGMAGVFITNSGTNGPLVMFGRELPLGSLPTAIASSVHIKCTMTDGLIVPVRVQAAHNQAAQLSMIAHGILGTGGGSGARPFVFTASDQAITTGAAQTANIYTTGPVRFTTGASSPAVSPRLLAGIRSLAVDFGLGVLKESTDGEVYPSHISIISRMPKIEFTTADVELMYEIGDGIAVTAFDTYFRKVDSSGQRVAVAGTSHIKISGTAGMLHPGGMSLMHKRPGEASFTYTPVLNTNITTIVVNAAIPTS